MLESLCHDSSVFVTLTYGPESCPEDGSVSRSDVTAWLCRVRRVFGISRFLVVGEYGSRTWRPHYHGLLFGASEDMALGSLWGLGNTQVGTVTPSSVRYCTSYVLKKMVSPGDARLASRRPEFMKCSRRPGLGVSYIPHLVDLHMTHGGAKAIVENRDVLSWVKIGGHLYPIGRLLTEKLRAELGVPSQDVQRMALLEDRVALERVVPEVYEAKTEGYRRRVRYLERRARESASL